MPEVTLTAWAWRTALGQGTDALARLLAGESAQRPPAAELAPYGVARLAPILDSPLPSPHGRVLHRMSLLGLEAAIPLASGWPGDRERLGVFTALGGLRALWEDLLVGLYDQSPDGERPWARGLGKVHPYWMLRHLSNNTHSVLTMALDARGDGGTFAGANSGAAAVDAASRGLAVGALDGALVLGVDTLLQPEILLEGARRGRFEHDGPGEAAVALLLAREGAGPRVRAFGGVKLPEAGESEPMPVHIPRALGQLGAATALAQIVAATGLPPGRWTATSFGPPDLVARVWVHNQERP